MVTIIDGRGTGRTTKLAAIVMSDPGSVLVVVNRASAVSVEMRWPSLKGRVATLEAVESGRLRGTGVRRAYVDDFETQKPNVTAILWNNGLSLAGYALDDGSHPPYAAAAA